MSEQAMGQRMVEEAVLEQLLDAFSLITDRTLTDEREGDAVRVEGSPDFIIGLDGKPFGIELTAIMGVDDAWDYVDEAFRLASRKSQSYSKRGIFRFPIALIMYSGTPELYEIKEMM